MDSLLEKLRAAAPQARDQRDRRRRARLKERHQQRIASGQKLPELPGIIPPKSEGGDEENKTTTATTTTTTTTTTGDEKGFLSPENQTEDAKPSSQDAHVSEGADIADRAASMLQGLRANANADADGERARRRRESAEDERRNRRLRRRNGASSGSKGGADGSALPAVREPSSPVKTEAAVTDEAEAGSPGKRPDSSGSQLAPPPSIVVSSTPDQPSENALPEGPAPDKSVETSE